MAIAAIAAVVVGCSDSRTSATDRLAGPSFSVGEPPPPPIPGTGSGFFSTGTDAAAQAATKNSPPSNSCAPVSTFIEYSYKFLQNKPGNNTWLDIDEFFPSDGHSHFHQILNNAQFKTDGSGDIVGPDFVFKIKDAVGAITTTYDESGAVRPVGANFVLTGTLITGNQSCQTTATLNLDLTGIEIGE